MKTKSLYLYEKEFNKSLNEWNLLNRRKYKNRRKEKEKQLFIFLKGKKTSLNDCRICFFSDRTLKNYILREKVKICDMMAHGAKRFKMNEEKESFYRSKLFNFLSSKSISQKLCKNVGNLVF